MGVLKTISFEEYNRVIEENAQLKKQLSEFEDTIDTKITGSFSATVREFSPDYCGDEFTPTVAVLTCYLSGPFMVYIGKENISKFEIGKTYYFEIEDIPIGNLTKAEFEKGCSNVEALFVLYNVSFKAIRIAEPAELGLESINIHYETV